MKNLPGYTNTEHAFLAKILKSQTRQAEQTPTWAGNTQRPSLNVTETLSGRKYIARM